MDPQRWRKVRGIFDELTALLPFEQQQRLADIAVSDPALCRSLEALMAADGAAAQRLGRLDALFALSGSLEEGSAAPIDDPQASDPLGLSGRSVSHFRVQQAFGAGGMGVVYRADDTRLGRTVALKFLLPKRNPDPSAKTRLLQEARAVAALDHANLCTMYEVGESAQGQLFLAMPLYAGETLRARLAREGRLPVPEALAIARQIAQGLACVHGAGIVHRDLKPGNVMLLPDAGVKLLDFGLARVRELSLTGSDLRLGTLPYMAPEQLNEAWEIDARADLWALGVVLYEMLTGRTPFGGEHEATTVDAILRQEPVPPSELRRDVPPAAEKIVTTLLQKDPPRRYGSADALLQDLATVSAAQERPSASWRAWGGSAMPVNRSAGWARRRAGRVALALAVLTGVGGPALSRLPGWWDGARHLKTSSVPPQPGAVSIAVLPFDNVSGAPENDYFADGMTQEISAALASVRSLRVISRDSVMRYKRSTKTARGIAGELRVAHLLTGSVQRGSDRVRIRVQLIDPRADAPVWSNTYDRPLEEIFAVQSDIAQQIVAALQAELTSGERARLTRRPTTNRTAHNYVLRAREFLGRFNQRDNDAGLALLHQALELDPLYPDAHAAMVTALAMRYWQVGDRRLLDAAVDAGLRAIELDPEFAEGYRSLGWALDHRGEPEAALKAHLRAVELSPNLSDGLASLYHRSFGRLDEAVRWWGPALETDPTGAMTHWHAARAYLSLGITARARELLEQSVAFEPSFTWAHYHLILALLQEGQRERARVQNKQLLGVTREGPSALTFAGLAAFAMDDLPAAREYLRRGLEKAPAYEKRQGTIALAWILQQEGDVEGARDLVESATRSFEQFWGGQPRRLDDLADLARIRLLQGDREGALRLLETAVRRGWRFVYGAMNAPILRSLQGHPRYDRLMAEVHADIERMRARVEREGW